MKLIRKIFASKYWWLMLLVVLFAINYLASVLHTRFDLTKEKRYTLSKATKDLVRQLDDDVEIDVFLKGEFPAGFKKLANSTGEFLQLLKDRNGSKIHYRFIFPQDEMPGTGKSYEDSLANLGVVPINLSAQVKAGEENKRVYPMALVKYKDKQELVSLYAGGKRMITPVEINSAEALMEYQFAKTLDKLTSTSKPLIGYSIGNGEPLMGNQLVNGVPQYNNPATADLEYTLRSNYELFTLNLNRQAFIPDTFKVLMIVKPSAQFTEDEKLKIDQYLMRGGKLLCFIDNLYAEQESLQRKAETVTTSRGLKPTLSDSDEEDFGPQTIAYDRNLNLTDQFFKYGFRINTDLLMDLQCDFLPFAAGGSANDPQYEFLHWNYYPLFESKGNHTINRNIGLVAGRFVNSIDTINATGISKTILLSSSADSRTISTPALISTAENRNAPEDANFNKADIPAAVLLEGSFTSLYKNRASQSQLDSLKKTGYPFLQQSSKDAKIIAVADGDIVLNDVSPQYGPLPMGLNFFTAGTQYEYQFANRDFLLNCLEYLVSKPGIIETRNKDIVLRLLNTQKVEQQKGTWQFINIGLPVLIILLLGLVYQQVRKRKYAA